MIHLKNSTNQASNLIIGLLLISFFLFSCEADEIIPEQANSDFNIPSIVSVGESLDLTLETNRNFDNIEWSISDGAKYYRLNSTHQFSKSGNYTISAKTFLNGFETSSSTKSVEVINDSKTFSFKESIYAQNVFFADNKIIIHANQDNSGASGSLTSYMFLDKELNLLSETNNLKEFDNELKSIVQFGDSAFAIASNNNTLSYYQYKSSISNEKNHPLSNTYLNYSSGYVYERNEGKNGFFIDFYSNSFEKLWTKSFENDNPLESRYLFTLGDKLFYLAFNSNSDKVFIEKFKNPSVVFEKKSFSLEKFAGNKEILFACSNPITNSINFAIYNSNIDKTTIYKINDNCSIDEISSTDGRFDGSPQFFTSTGEFIVKNATGITKYNTDWSLISKLEINSSDFGICQIGNNLSLIYENLSSGKIRLSYIDKHLNPVLFN